MLFGPIFSLELVTSARRTRYFVVRVIYALVLLIALCITYNNWFSYRSVSNLQAVANFAGVFFIIFSWVQLITVVLLTPAMVAGTVSVEHERRTIEYLLTSQLSNAEIVLGKLASRLLYVALQLLAGLPVLALTMMLGGIAPEALLLVFVITLTTLVALAALSMAVSVGARRTREAMTRVYLLLFAFLVVPQVFEGLLGSWVAGGLLGQVQGWLVWLLEGLTYVHPFYVLAMASGMPGSGSESVWWHLLPMVVSYAGFSVICLAAAVWSVRRVYVKALGASPRKPGLTRRWWRPALGTHAMLWKELFAERAAIRLGWAGSVASALLVLVVIILTIWTFLEDFRSGAAWRAAPGYAPFLDYAGGMGTAISCLGLLLVAARAAGTVTAEKERDSWTTLISTPLSPAEIILGKLAGNLYATRGWVMLLCFLWTLAVVLQPEYLLVLPFVAGTLAILAVFASALGILFSLLCANSLRAMGATLAVALVLGGGYLFCCFPMFFVGGGDAGVILFMAPCVPFLLAAPHFLGMELIRQYPGNLEFEVAIAAYVLGMLLYSFAVVGLLTYSIEGFDRLTGRTRREHPLAGPPRPIARTAIPGIKNVGPLPPTTEPRRCDPTGD